MRFPNTPVRPARYGSAARQALLALTCRLGRVVSAAGRILDHAVILRLGSLALSAVLDHLGHLPPPRPQRASQGRWLISLRAGPGLNPLKCKVGEPVAYAACPRRARHPGPPSCPERRAAIATRPLSRAQYAGAILSPMTHARRGSSDWPVTGRKQGRGDVAWRGRRGERFACGDAGGRRPPAWAVRPAPPPAAGLRCSCCPR